MKEHNGGRKVMTRRVLLAAGGLTVLGACTPETVTSVAARGPGARPGSTASAVPNGSPGSAASIPVDTTGRPPAARHPAGPHGAPPSHAHLARADNAARRRRRAAGGDLPMTHISDGPKVIALTIDDGPDPVYTPQVLRLLAKYHVTATFSMIGIQVQAHPGVAREVAAAGHLIANHTWSHRNLAWLGLPAVTDQMDRATAEIHAVTGRLPDLFRAPYGAWSPVVLRQCARTGMTPLAWNVDPRDWSRPGVASIVTNIMRNTGTGSIILEHDGGGNRSQTVAALSQVIPRLQAAGYHFTTP
jgi:peptidoglycan/xylan/chitin deacetylase (PgdA/CDA1 family)